MEAVVVGGLAVLIFGIWEIVQDYKTVRKNGESATVGRCDALKNNNFVKTR